MAHDHWFDALNKALVRDTPRRTLLRAGAASLLLGSAPAVEAAKNKHRKPTKKGNGKRTGKGKRNKGKGRDRGKRNRDQAPCEGELCIFGDGCCSPGLRCCGELCVNTFDDDNNCGECYNRCSPGKICFGGVCECQNGLTRCGEFCLDTSRDTGNCGGCDQRCLPLGTPCCDGVCTENRFNNNHCGRCNNACPPGWECCHAQCIDSEDFTCCRNHPPSAGACHVSSFCCTNADGEPACCD
jgi:hypothetical protein